MGPIRPLERFSLLAFVPSFVSFPLPHDDARDSVEVGVDCSTVHTHMDGFWYLWIQSHPFMNKFGLLSVNAHATKRSKEVRNLIASRPTNRNPSHQQFGPPFSEKNESEISSHQVVLLYCILILMCHILLAEIMEFLATFCLPHHEYVVLQPLSLA